MQLGKGLGIALGFLSQGLGEEPQVPLPQFLLRNFKTPITRKSQQQSPKQPPSRTPCTLHVAIKPTIPRDSRRTSPPLLLSAPLSFALRKPQRLQPLPPCPATFSESRGDLSRRLTISHTWSSFFHTPMHAVLPSLLT